ncbi:DoxX family protein [Streptomyces cavernicola]|uniref:DoxX family protein n=1 Tax=Streptomyces cavernicola TaxID=3043613 RepID=A0ABT6SAZ8_9ACTN|nr:DoxX family protein [Streptomyces sp. B-S-A6]MDI3405376.1 DoxX family protein [Streptomyces sp. B-S-A6]
MFLAYVVVTVFTALVVGAIGVLDLRRAPAVLETSAAVNVPVSWVAPLGVPKVAATGGLLLGLAGWRWLGVAAGVGLVLLFVGAVLTHVRARVYSTMWAPAVLLALSAVTLWLGVGAS